MQLLSVGIVFSNVSTAALSPTPETLLVSDLLGSVRALTTDRPTAASAHHSCPARAVFPMSIQHK